MFNQYKATGRNYVEWTNNSGINYEGIVDTYCGRIYENGDNVLITNKSGTPSIFDKLIMDGFALSYSSRILRSTGISYHFTKLPEMVPADGDYLAIANIYRELIRDDIVLGPCTFVKVGEVVFIQMPCSMTRYTCDHEYLAASRELFYGDNIEQSLPMGMDSNIIRSLIWDPETIDKIEKIEESLSTLWKIE